MLFRGDGFNGRPRHAAGLVTVSAGLKRRLVALGTPPERVRVLRNGVDPAVFRPPADREAARRALGFTRPTLLAVGNLIPLKRHALIVEALAHLPGIDLAIAGDGPERPRIEALARQLGLADRVRLLGRLTQESLPGIYGAADLLVHPSLREGWPNVLLESMACGTPVLATNFDSVGEIVGAPEAGRIVAEATPTGLAEAISELLAAPPRREATRRYAEGFDWQSRRPGKSSCSARSAISERRPRRHRAPPRQQANRGRGRYSRSGPDRESAYSGASRVLSEATTRSAVFPSHSGGGPLRDHRPPSTLSTSRSISGTGTRRLVPSEIVAGRSVVSRTVRHGIPR